MEEIECPTTDEAMKLAALPMNQLPDPAKKYLHFLTEKIGMCIEVCITTYAHYAQWMLHLPCTDEMYKIDQQGLDWFEEHYPRLNNEELKKMIIGITDEDIEQDIRVEMYSAYGGKILGSYRICLIDSIIEDSDREVNKDFYFAKIKS